VTVIDVDVNNWDDEVIDSDKITIVEFWHERCPWCQRTIPIYDALSQEYDDQLHFKRINVLDRRENQELAMNYGVRGTPIFIFFCDGQPVGTNVGFQTKDQLTQSIKDMLDKHKACLTQSTQLPVDTTK